MMDDALLAARIVDLVIVLTIIEGLLLAAYRRRTGRGIPIPQLVANLAAGLALMLALRFAVTSGGLVWIALCLLAAGIVHAMDLWRRWER